VARDKDYMAWSLFDSSSNLMLAYPQQPLTQQETASLPVWFQALKTGQTGMAMISPVYYNAHIHKAFVDIYSPIIQGGQPGGPFLGFLLVKLNLDYIWSIVQSDKGIGNSGSSFILDQNGVRIADTFNQHLFTAVALLPSQLQQQITTENWYETNSGPLVQANTTLADILKSQNPPNHFTLTPYNQTQNYQAAFAKTTTISWTYFVISPSSVVTQVADQQLLTTIAGALILLILAALVGTLASNRISRPIMRSVVLLRENSQALNSLAKKQQSTSEEQSWMIGSSQVGQRSVQYYTDAICISAHRLGEIGIELRRNWQRQDIKAIKRSLQDIISAANYIEKAAHYQTDNSQMLTTAIKVTLQVNEQLTNSSTLTTKAASQLKQVVYDLRKVVGH
jgi:hypothetical protein